MSSVSGRLIKGSAWMSASRIVVNALSLLSTIILARLLVPEDFGIVSLAMTLLAIITSITELSLSMALVRHAAPTAEHFDTAWTLNALRGLVIGAIFVACGWPVAALYGDDRLVPVMAVLGFGLFVTGLMNPRTVLLQRELVFWQEFVLDVVQKLAAFVISIAIAYLYRTYWALLVGYVIGQIVSTIVSYAIMPYRPRIGFKHFRDLMSFSVWLTGGQIVNTLNWRFEYLLIAQVLGMGPLGHYSVGSNLAQIPTRETTSPLMKVIYPGFATIRDNPVRLASAYQRAQSLLTAIALPAGFGAALIADPLIRLAMGDKWEPVIFVVQVLSAVFALQTLGSLSTSLGMARGETRILFQRNVLMLIVRVPLIVMGMLLAGLVSGLFSILVSMQLVRRFTGLSLGQQLSANTRALASTAAMVGSVVVISPLLGTESDAVSLLTRIVVIGAVGALVYCGTSVVLWIAMHKPSGPEREVQLLVGKLLAKLRIA
jgi:lipopolysaccharide exporter